MSWFILCIVLSLDWPYDPLDCLCGCDFCAEPCYTFPECVLDIDPDMWPEAPPPPPPPV